MTYVLLENPLYTAMLECQKRLLTFEIRVLPAGSPLSKYVSLQASPVLGVVVNPFSEVISPMPPINMQLVMIDIYGQEAALDFQVIFVSGYAAYTPCLTTANVLQKGFALDHQYIIGSLWRHKLHIPIPYTPNKIDCTILQRISARLVSSSGIFQPLPSVMRLEPDFQRLTIMIPAT
jgi:hypothetical protein